MPEPVLEQPTLFSCPDEGPRPITVNDENQTLEPICPSEAVEGTCIEGGTPFPADVDEVRACTHGPPDCRDGFTMITEPTYITCSKNGYEPIDNQADCTEESATTEPIGDPAWEFRWFETEGLCGAMQPDPLRPQELCFLASTAVTLESGDRHCVLLLTTAT